MKQLKVNDTVIISVNQLLNEPERIRREQELKEKLGCNVVILDGGMKVEAVINKVTSHKDNVEYRTKDTPPIKPKATTEP